jgi:hypothetical protein
VVALTQPTEFLTLTAAHLLSRLSWSQSPYSSHRAYRPALQSKDTRVCTKQAVVSRLSRYPTPVCAQLSGTCSLVLQALKKPPRGFPGGCEYPLVVSSAARRTWTFLSRGPGMGRLDRCLADETHTDIVTERGEAVKGTSRWPPAADPSASSSPLHRLPRPRE